MSYEDRLSIVTPEGIVVDVALAGLGSRIVAQMVDSLIKFAIVLALAIAAGVVGSAADPSPGLLLVIFIIVNGLLLIAYDVAFEIMQNGRTPGKRAVGIRVVMVGGAPVTFLPSLIRNVLRLIDALPSFYLVAIISVLVSEKNQRLGDLAAGTVVAREQGGTSTTVPPPLPPPPPQVVAWDVTGITAEEIGAIRRFLERRPQLSPGARHGLALELAARLRPKVVGAPAGIHPEQFLEWVARAKSSRG